MKEFFVLILAALSLSQQKCNRKTAVSSPCFKGRLEVKGICANYTIALLEGNLDASQLEASWTDETTNKTYKNVFALGSPCSFPTTITEGQEFYFTLDSAAQDCAVCQAYYPKPSKSLAIKVLDKPCP